MNHIITTFLLLLPLANSSFANTRDDDGDCYCEHDLTCTVSNNPLCLSVQPGDCDDSNPLVHPAMVWYPDDDKDGYGSPYIDDRYEQISVGRNHSCALDSIGTVECWGDDTKGQSTTSTGPMLLNISSGAEHTCAINISSQVTCWGDNTLGQTSAPTQSSYSIMDSGAYHSCAIGMSSALTCWGDNTEGQTVVPTVVSNEWSRVSAGKTHTCGLQGSGSDLYCWGNNDFQQAPSNGAVPLESGWKRITAGGRHTCGIKADDTIQCFGDDAYSQVSNTPTETSTWLISGKYRELSAGERHTCALSFSGAVVCWGINDGSPSDYGQVSSAPTTNNFIKISSGQSHSCAVTNSGEVQCWGDDTDGKTIPTQFRDAPATPDYIGCDGFWDTLPIQTPAYSPYASDCDDDPTVGDIRSPGEVESCGSSVDEDCSGRSNDCGDILDDDDDGDGYHGAADCNDTLANVYPGAQEICDGVWNDCDHPQWSDSEAPPNETDDDEDGYVECDAHAMWAGSADVIGGFDCDDTDDQITSADRFYPDTDEDGIGTAWSLLASSGSTFCALDSAGRIYCWGENLDLQVTGAPVDEVGFTDLVAGDDFFCALDSINEVFCWGNITENEVYDWPAVNNFTLLAAGNNHACGIDSNGLATCWGGALGFGDPTVIAYGNFSDPYVSLALGWQFSCALTASGYLDCWDGGHETSLNISQAGPYAEVKASEYGLCAQDISGRNACFGTSSSSLIMNPPTGTGYSGLMVQGGNACAIDSGGGLECWGADYPTNLTENTGPSYYSLQRGSTWMSVCGLHTDGTVSCFDSQGTSWHKTPTSSGNSHLIMDENNHACVIDAYSGIYCWDWDKSWYFFNKIAGEASYPLQSCDSLTTPGYSTLFGDCNDEDFNIGGGTPYYQDTDSDGYGDYLATPVYVCSSNPPSAPYVPNNQDCDDADSLITVGDTYYPDLDGDGYGDPTISRAECLDPGPGYTLDNTDCDDTNNSVTASFDWYPDSDGDGYGDSQSTPYTACTPQIQTDVKNNSDCEDTSISITVGDSYFEDLDVDGFGQAWQQVEVGLVLTCAIDTVGQLKCWGDDLENIITGVPASSNTAAVSIGKSHACKLDYTGSPTCWGNNTLGQVSPTPAGSQYSNLRSGDDFSCALSSSAAVICWGDDSNNIISGAPSGAAIDVAAGAKTACAILQSDGRIECWGDDTNSQITDRPASLGFTSINGNFSAMCAIGEKGEISCWGDSPGAPPVGVFTAVSVGSGYSCAIDDQQEIICWGLNAGRNIQAGPTTWTNTAEDLSTSSDHACLIDSSGRLHCWGNTSHAMTQNLGDAYCSNPNDGSRTTTGDCDADDTSTTKGTPYYVDLDADGNGDSTDPGSLLCFKPTSGYSIKNTDCDDTDDTVTEGATYYSDVDGDSYGDSNDIGTIFCQPPLSGGYALTNTDCDDNDILENPSVTWYPDTDGDTYGNDADPQICERNDSSDVTNDSDCDDNDILENPETTWYADLDGDGYGNLASSNSCERGDSTDVTDSTDCDDTDATEYPTVNWYTDSDEDGYGVSQPNQMIKACDRASPSDVNNDTDCNDSDPDQNPSINWYTDSDGDGYGDPSEVSNCEPNDVTDVIDSSDCDDDDPAINPSLVWYEDFDEDGYGVNHTTVAATTSASCALDSTGHVECWGAAGSFTVVENAPTTGGLTSLTSGKNDGWYDFVCGLDGDGRISCWGDDSWTIASAPPNTDGFTEIKAGWYHACALNKTGEISCWGDNSQQQVTNVPSSTLFTHFDVNGDYACGITTTGYIDCWGSNSNSQIANTPTGTGYQGIALGPKHACAINASNGIECWGRDNKTQSSNAPTSGTYQALALGKLHSCALNSTGTIACWGDSSYTQTWAPAGNGFESITTFEHFSCGNHPVNGVACWGDNFYDQVGSTPEATPMTSISVAMYHACGIDNAGNIHCWGNTTEDFWDVGQVSGAPSPVTSCASPGVTFSTTAGDCNDTNNNISDASVTYYLDNDGDGYGDPLSVGSIQCEDGLYLSDTNDDCDDSDSLLNPGVTWYNDQDLDGYGDTFGAGNNCSPLAASDVNNNEDCDDSAAFIQPKATEICDAIDNDCDGDIDDDDLSLDGSTTTLWYQDQDGDTFGDPTISALACNLSETHTDNSLDCDDNEENIYPGAPEICDDAIDQDCDLIDLSCAGDDNDGDGFCDAESCDDGALPGDCNDSEAAINPWASELCNGIDDNCDAFIDENLSLDEDNDGHTAIGSCLGSADDCNDFIAQVNPSSPEDCNGIDDDCNGFADDGLVIDDDGDGFVHEDSCGPFAVFDCDDTNPLVNPGLLTPDTPGDGVDANCDGSDEDPLTVDNDGDGYCESAGCTDGSIGGLTPDCDDTDPTVYPGAPEVDDLIDHDCDDEESINNLGDKDVDEDGLTSLDGDCDDFDDQIHIDAIERCNGIDDNCDGYLPIDEWDLDNDGYVACVAFSPNTWLGDSYVIGGDDCDDNNAQSRPGLAENCYDGIDNDCNGIIDIDADGDGDGYTTCQGDCNDSDISIYPTNQELCNGIDDDCDGRVDEGFDNDLDGYMSCLACSDTYFTCDCDDSNALSHPNAPENCYDGIDNDCDGEVDQTGIDEDKDGWEVCDGDCDDNNKWRSPGTPERCNGIDDDCDNEIDNGYDKDGDGMTRCTGDCDDSNPSIYFGATEICNDVDENCDQSLGEGSDDDEDGWLNQDCGGEDCDDLNAAIGPDQVEICDDGLDNNCDQGVDTADIACDVHSGVYQGWFCGIQGTSPANWAWGLLALLVATRRRDPSFNSTP